MSTIRTLATTVPPGVALLGLAAFGWYSWSPASSTARRSVPAVRSSVAVDVRASSATGQVSSSTVVLFGSIGDDAYSLNEPVSVPGSTGVPPASASGFNLQHRNSRSFIAPVSMPVADSVDLSQLTSGHDLPEYNVGSHTGIAEGNLPDAVGHRSDPAPDLPLPLPMAALDPSGAVPTGEAAQSALDGLQQSFLAAVAGPEGPAGDDPVAVADTVARRWQLAQPASDQMFEVFYGSQAYMAQQTQQHLVQQAMAALAQ